MTSIQTVGFLYPGAMGASLAWTLHTRLPRLKLLTSLESRSEATRARARSVGLEDVPLGELVRRSDVIVSILPPSEALRTAREVVALLPEHEPESPSGPDTVSSSSGDDRASASAWRSKPIYIDANAIAPTTCSHIGEILTSARVRFLDGSVIGGPAKQGYDPMIYLSTASEHERDGSLDAVAQALGGGDTGQDPETGKRKGKGLMLELMMGAGEGAASALKMAYGGISKGTTGLVMLMILAAHAHSSETSGALAKELARSRPDALKSFTGSISGSIPKAYRFVGEMEENASFIRTALSSLPSIDSTSSSAEITSSPEQDARAVAETYEGLAKVYQRIADDLKLGLALASSPRNEPAGTMTGNNNITTNFRGGVESSASDGGAGTGTGRGTGTDGDHRSKVTTLIGDGGGGGDNDPPDRDRQQEKPESNPNPNAGSPDPSPKDLQPLAPRDESVDLHSHRHRHRGGRSTSATSPEAEGGVIDAKTSSREGEIKVLRDWVSEAKSLIE